MKQLLVAALLFGCAAMPVRHPRPSLAGDDALLVAVRGRRPYLRSPEHEGLRIRVGFFIRQSGIGMSGVSRVPSSGEDEHVWMPLTMTVFTDVPRFIEHGFVGVEAVGIGPDEHPLRQHCYGDLLRAVSVDIESSDVHPLYAQLTATRPDPEYGCIYRLRP